MAYTPPVGFHFRVDFGIAPGIRDDVLFQEVGGLGAEVTTEDLVEGGENRFTHRLPVRTKYSNLVLKRGLFVDSENLEATDEHKPTTVNVVLLDEKGEPLGHSYNFNSAWPVKWSISDLKSSSNEVVVESLELSYQFYTIER